MDEDEDDVRFELDALKRVVEKEAAALGGRIDAMTDRVLGVYGNLAGMLVLIVVLLVLILWRAW